jgi:transposase-like protein
MRYSEEEKRMWLEDFQASGKSAWAYAKENGLNLQTLKQWTRPEKEAEASFVEVTPQIINPVRDRHEILIEKGDVRIHIPLAAGCGELRAVMEGLGRVL